MISLLFLAVAAFASLALGAGTAYLVVRWTRKPILWVLAPVFAILWLAVGAVPLATFAWVSAAPPRPVLPPPQVPAPVQTAPTERVGEAP